MKISFYDNENHVITTEIIDNINKIQLDRLFTDLKCNRAKIYTIDQFHVKERLRRVGNAILHGLMKLTVGYIGKSVAWNYKKLDEVRERENCNC